MFSLELRSSAHFGRMDRLVQSLHFVEEGRRLLFPGWRADELAGRSPRRLYEEYENDAVADSAAALAYYFVFSLFPFLFFLDAR